MRRLSTPFAISVCRHLQSSSVAVAALRGQGEQAAYTIEFNEHDTVIDVNENVTSLNKRVDERTLVLCSEGYGPSTDLLTGITPQNTLHIHTPPMHPEDVAVQRQVLALAAPELNNITVEQAPDLSKKLHSYQALPLHTVQPLLHEHNVNTNRAASLTRLVRSEMIEQWSSVNRKWEDQLREVSQMIINQVMNDHVHQLNTFSALQGEQRRAVTEMVMNCIRDEMDELRRTLSVQATNTQRLLEHTVAKEEQETEHDNEEKVNHQQTFTKPQTETGYAFPIEQLVHSVTSRVAEQLQSGFMSSQENTSFAIEQLQQRVTQYFQQLQQNVSEALQKMESLQLSTKSTKENIATHDLSFAEKDENSTDAKTTTTTKTEQEETNESTGTGSPLQTATMPHTQTRLLTLMSQEIRHAMEESMLAQQEHVSGMLRDILSAVQARDKDLDERHTRNAEPQINMKEAHQQLLEEKERHTDVTERDDHNDTLHKDSTDDKKSLIINQFHALASENRVQIRELEEFIEGALQTATDNIRLSMTMELKKLTKQGSKEVNKEVKSFTSASEKDDQSEDHKETVVVDLIQGINVELDRALSMSETSLQTIHATKASVELIEQRQQHVERVLNELKVLMEQTSLELHAQHHTLQSSLQQQAEQVASSLSEALAHHNQHQHETSPATTQVDPEGRTNQITLEKTHELTQPASVSSASSVLLSSPSSAVQAELRDHLSHMTRLIGELRQEVQVVDSHTATIINAQQVQREQELEQLRQDLFNMSNALTQSITNVNPLESSAKLASTIEQMYDKLNKFCTEDWQSKLREAASVAAADAVNAAMQTQLANLPVLLSTSATQLQKPEESLSREPEQQQEQALPLQERYLSQISKEEIATTVEQVIRPHIERLVHEADNLHQARRNLQAQEMIELTNAFTLAVHSALNEFATTQGKELQAAVEQAREASVQASRETEPARESTTELNALETRLTQHVHSDMEASSNKLQNELITQLDTSISHKLQDLQEKLIQSFQSESNTPPEIDLTNLFKYIDGAVTVIRDELMQQKELNQTQSTQLVESISRMVQHNFTSHETSLESKLAAQMTTCLENAMAEVKSMVQREEKSRNARHNELDTQLNVLPDRVEERVSGLLRKVQQTISDGAKTHTTALEHMEEKMQTLPTLVEIQSSTRKVELATSSAIRELGTQIDTETSLLNDVMVELRKNAAATAAASVAAKSNDKEDILRETEKLHDSYKTLNDKVEIMEGAAGGRFQEIMKAAENNNAAIKVIRSQLETLQSTVANIHGPQHIALLESIQELLFRENMHEEERAEPQTSTTTTTTTNTATTPNAESNISKSNLEGNTLSDADNNTELLMEESNSAKVLKSLEAIHEQLKEHSAQLIKLQTEAAKVTAQNDKLLETNVHWSSSSSSSSSLSNVNDTVTNTSKDVLQAQQQQQQQQQQEELLIKRIEELLQRLNTASTTATTATATTSPSPSNTSTTATDVEGKADVQKILFELRQEIHDLRDMVEKQHKPVSESIVVSDANAKVATSTSSPSETHEEVKAERENVHEDVSETVIDTDVLSVAVVEGMQPKLNEMSHSLYTQLSSLLDKVQSRIEEVEKTHHTNHQEVLSSVGQIAQDLRSAIKDINTVAENIECTHTTSELRNTNTKTAMDTSSMTTIAEEQSSLTCKAMEQTLEVHTRSVLDALQDAQQSTDAIVNRYRADLLQAMRELPQQIGNVVQEHLTHAESTHNDHLAKTLNTHFTEQASTIQRYMESNIAHVMAEQTNGVIKEIAQMHGDYVQRLHKDNSASQSSTLQAMSELSKVAKSLESGHQTLLQAQEQTRQKVEDTLRSQKDLNESFVLLRRQEEEHKNKLEKEKEEQQKEKKASSMSASTLASLPSETTAEQETQQEVLVTKMSEAHRSILPTWLLLLLTPLAVCVAMLLCAYYLFACFLLAFVPLPESHLRGTTPEKVAATTTPTLPSSSSSSPSPPSRLQTQPNTATPHELHQRTLPTELTNNNNDRGHTSRGERAASPPHKSHNRSSRIADSVL